MSNKTDNDVMFCRRALRMLSRDLLDPEAKHLGNQLDRALRTENQGEFSRLCGLLPELVQEDAEPWAISERLQVVSLIRFPIWELDQDAIFKKTRGDVSSASLSLRYSDYEIWRHAGSMITEIVSDLPSIEGRHGPGVVSETSSALQKREVVRYNASLRHLERFLFPIVGNAGDWVRHVPSSAHARVLMVPKDHKTLRMISAEPAQTQFVQQAFKRHWERKMSHHRVFRNIDITDQTKQHRLARKGPHVVATLDLSCASDTIRVKHLLLLALSLETRQILLSLRTACQNWRGTLLPTQGLYPMGAATCFPFETMLFYALAYSYSILETGHRPKHLGVYGDDIVIDAHLAGGLTAFLQRSAFIPNQSKSFIGGHFLETCGLHLYKGVDVTPVKMKRKAPNTVQDVENITYFDYKTRFDRKCMPAMASFISDCILFKPTERWNPSLQRREVRTLELRKKIIRGSSAGYPDALLYGSGDVPSPVITTGYGWQPLVG